MTTFIVTLICIYHTILRWIGKLFGLLFAGLLVGFMTGVRDIKDMYKYLAYRAAASQLKTEKKDVEKDSDSER